MSFSSRSSAPLLLFVAATALAGRAAGAAELARSKEGQFQIELPARVKEHRGYHSSNGVTQWRTYTFSLIHNGVIYEAACWHLTEDGAKWISIPKSIRSRRDSEARRARRKKAKILIDKENSEGTAFMAEYPDGRVVRMGWYRKGRRMYQVRVEGPASQGARGGAGDRFFRSFKTE